MLHAFTHRLALSLLLLFLCTLPTAWTLPESGEAAADEPPSPPPSSPPAPALTTPASPPPVAPPHSAPPLPLTAERGAILATYDIVPTIIPVAPASILKLAFGTDVRVAELGRVLTPKLVANQPRLNYNVHANRFYTVFMIDPDAPSRARPIAAQWVHWLVVNIPGRDLSRGETIVEYVGAAPPEGTGLHRYILMVLEQSHKIDTQLIEKINKHTGSSRVKWSWDRWMWNHDAGAKLVALNFFLAEFDDSVPATHRQLAA